MDSLIVSAIRPTIHIDNGFVDCRRGPSNHPGVDTLFLVPLFRTFRAGNGFLDCQGRSLHNFGLRMDSLIVSVVHPTLQLENAFVDPRCGPSDLTG